MDRVLERFGVSKIANNHIVDKVLYKRYRCESSESAKEICELLNKINLDKERAEAKIRAMEL